MVAGVFLAAHGAIDAGGDEPLRRLFAQQEMIDAQPRVARPAIPQVTPVGISRLVRMQIANRIAPAVAEQTGKARSALRLQQRVLVVGFGRINITIGRDDVEIAGEHDRHAGGEQIRGMRREPIHPGELVGKFRPRLRVAVGRIERRDQHAVHRRLDVTRLRVGGIAGQFVAGNDRISAARQNGDAIPRFLTAPDRAIAGLGNCGLRKFAVGGFQLLQADHVRLRRSKPGQEISQALIDVIDVEGGDLHDARDESLAFLDSQIACSAPYCRNGCRGSRQPRSLPLRA